MSGLRRRDPEVYRAILDEIAREEDALELIASENFVSEEVLEAQGSVLTNKYAEGYPGARWYNGCHNVDVVESIAIERAKTLFGAEHANVQPHSGTQANMAVYFALLDVGDTVLALDLACGGHLSHGHPHNFSGKYFKTVAYGVDRKTEILDYDEIMELAKEQRPRMILAGATAYPRIIDFKKFRRIADAVGAYLVVDMAHIAGLVAAGVHPSPIPLADVVTTTNHKTLRGPRGAMIMCKKEFAKKIDTEVFPGIQGGPLMHVIAAKAVALREASGPDFARYQRQVVENARTLAAELAGKGYRIVSGGTDTHLFLVDLTGVNLTGRDASRALDRAGITVNKNLIPYDTKSSFIASGIRIGTPAVTTRGMRVSEMKRIAALIDTVLRDPDNEIVIRKVRSDVKTLVRKFPLYRALAKRLQGRA